MISRKSDLKKEDSDIFISGHRLRVRWLRHCRNTESTRPVLVFLHEALGCIEMWREFPEEIALRTGCDALIYDRLGYGRSDPLPLSSINTEYLYPESWESLPAVLSHCGVKHSILFGHSDGGTIALLFASKYPELIDGVIVNADAPPTWHDNTGNQVQQCGFSGSAGTYDSDLLILFNRKFGDIQKEISGLIRKL